MLDIHAIRNDFTILSNKDQTGKPYIYLDNAATSLTPKGVVDVIVEYYNTLNANIHRGLYQRAIETEERVNEARGIVSRFIGAGFEEVIFTRNATDSSNMLVDLLMENHHIMEGDKVLVSSMDHSSNFLPWLRLRKKNVQVEFIGHDKDLAYDYQALEEHLKDGNTKYVVCSYVSHVTGMVNDVAYISELAHRYGAKIVIDATQAIPHLSLEVKKLDCDYLFFSGHKALGPMGVGVLYGKKELLTSLQPCRLGGGIVARVDRKECSFVDIPNRFEAGTMNIPAVLGLGKAFEYLEKIGMENIRAYEKNMCDYCIEQFEAKEYFQLFGTRDTSKRVPVFSFVVESVDTAELCEILNDSFHIALRSGQMCAQLFVESLCAEGVNRMSPCCYNTIEEMETFFAAVERIVKSYSCT